MKTPRLLPVVIAAATALLLLKGIGLVTSGGYVLTGTGSAVAAGAGGGHGASGGGTAAGVDPTMALPTDATMTDTSPTLDDGAPVLPLGQETPAASGGHGAPVEAAAHAEEPAAAGHEAAAPAEIVCPTDVEGGHATGDEPKLAESAKDGCPVPVAINEHGDALPMEITDGGVLAPMASSGGSEAELLGRLGERRDSLDGREKELEMRMALLEAAEKRLDERTATLKAIEARINALVDERKAAESEQFTGIVAMYETMKPKEAATIFNQLDMPVMLRVARAMNPRKMAPILARMDPLKAKSLTSGLAVEDVEPTLDVAAEALTSLPQIVGQ